MKILCTRMVGKNAKNFGECDVPPSDQALPIINAIQASWLKVSPQVAALSKELDLPSAETRRSPLCLNDETIVIGSEHDLDSGEKKRLSDLISELQPWRVGPYSLHGVHIDSEWRSGWKWKRLADHLHRHAPTSAIHIADIGSSSGYFLLRALAELGERVKLAIALDRNERNILQLKLLTKYLESSIASRLFFGACDEAILHGINSVFEIIFSLGTLYHQRNETEFLDTLRSALTPGGWLYLETIVNPGPEPILSPPRYLKMKNVHTVHTENSLRELLSRVGFSEVDLLATAPSSQDEQRRTAFSVGESLSDFLDSRDRSRTIEGFPAPLRVTYACKR